MGFGDNKRRGRFQLVNKENNPPGEESGVKASKKTSRPGRNKLIKENSFPDALPGPTLAENEFSSQSSFRGVPNLRHGSSGASMHRAESSNAHEAPHFGVSGGSGDGVRKFGSVSPGQGLRRGASTVPHEGPPSGGSGSSDRGFRKIGSMKPGEAFYRLESMGGGEHGMTGRKSTAMSGRMSPAVMGVLSQDSAQMSGMFFDGRGGSKKGPSKKEEYEDMLGKSISASEMGGGMRGMIMAAKLAAEERVKSEERKNRSSLLSGDEKEE